MKKYDKLIFVCTGNTCRSPMAATIFKSMETSSDIEVLSRGLVVLFSEPSNPKADTVLKSHNLDLKDHKSRGLKNSEITDTTLILTMTEQQKKNVLDNFTNANDVYTITEFVGETGEVDDPYGGSLIEYEEVYSQLSLLIKKLVYKLDEGGSI
ncbi:MAG: low molecular weight protein arginine phosphatase [Clostridiales bacterium]|jgi:protein-tyrosine-phosphatase|nr:low molecular weight protein arginine phosphatase [Clostridiales bacterium]